MVQNNDLGKPAILKLAVIDILESLVVLLTLAHYRPLWSLKARAKAMRDWSRKQKANRRQA